MKSIPWVLLSFAITTACATSKSVEPVRATDSATGVGHYADVNGLHMYYEEYGPKSGIPLVLLHGGGSTIDVSWGRILPFLSKNHYVIAIEEQGHGRTSDRDAPVQFETSADDVAALLKKINVSEADVFGFSNGASVGMEVAIRHPGLVRKLIFASSFTKKSGAIPEFWGFMKNAKFENMPQPLKDAFLKVNPDPKKLRTMHDKDAARMQHFKDIPDSDVKKVKIPTLVMFGDRDLVRFEHAEELKKLIPTARVVVLPGAHGEYLGELVMTQKPSRFPEITAEIVDEFLKSL